MCSVGLSFQPPPVIYVPVVDIDTVHGGLDLEIDFFLRGLLEPNEPSVFYIAYDSPGQTFAPSVPLNPDISNAVRCVIDNANRSNGSPRSLEWAEALQELRNYNIRIEDAELRTALGLASSAIGIPENGTPEPNMRFDPPTTPQAQEIFQGVDLEGGTCQPVDAQTNLACVTDSEGNFLVRINSAQIGAIDDFVQDVARRRGQTNAASIKRALIAETFIHEVLHPFLKEEGRDDPPFSDPRYPDTVIGSLTQRIYREIFGFEPISAIFNELQLGTRAPGTFDIPPCLR